jgi:hypothetical protein
MQKQKASASIQTKASAQKQNADACTDDELNESTGALADNGEAGARLPFPMPWGVP